MAVSLTPDQQRTLKRYRQRLLLLILLSSGLDALIFWLGSPVMLTSLGGSLVVDEIVEWVVSHLLARNRMRLSRWYQVAGFIPVPGVTALSLQATMAYLRSRRQPEQVLAQLSETGA